MKTALAAILWCAAVAFHVWTLDVHNDHFGRISPGRQIARYGELPFRDFFDPGYFLTEFSSAAVQLLFGDNLLGEFLLSGAFIATGAVIVLLLSWRISGSWVVGLVAALLALLAMPRPYDYDKFLFYPLGVLLCWRYIDRRRLADLTALGAGLVAAALFRYDSAAYLGAGALAALVASHWGEWQLLTRRVGLLALAVAVLSAPVLLFLQVNGGLGNTIDQVVNYGVREAQPLQLVAIDPPPPPGTVPETVGARLRRALPIFRMRMPLHLYNSRAAAVLYFFLMALPLAAAIMLWATRSSSPAQRADRARVWSLIAICVAVNLFILRPPMTARVGGMAGPAAVLAVWIACCAWGAQRGVFRLAAIAILAVSAWSVSVAADWSSRFDSETSVKDRLTENLAALRESPPSPRRLSAGHLDGLVRYLRECTVSDDRVFATWFVPELPFFAQRAFAGRVWTTWQWSDLRFQRRIAEALQSQSAVVIVDTEGYGNFSTMYPVVDWVLQNDYRNAGEGDFGVPSASGKRYRVLVHKRRAAIRMHPASSIECFT